MNQDEIRPQNIPGDWSPALIPAEYINSIPRQLNLEKIIGHWSPRVQEALKEQLGYIWMAILAVIDQLENEGKNIATLGGTDPMTPFDTVFDHGKIWQGTNRGELDEVMLQLNGDVDSGGDRVGFLPDLRNKLNAYNSYVEKRELNNAANIIELMREKQARAWDLLNQLALRSQVLSGDAAIYRAILWPDEIIKPEDSIS